MPIDFPSLFKTIEGNVTSLAKESLSDYLSQGTSDGIAIVSGLKDKIELWSLQLSVGDIDADNFKSLILGEKDLMKMKALTQAGLTFIRIDKFKSDVCNIIVNTVTSII